MSKRFQGYDERKTSRFIVARMSISGAHFEILVNPDLALNFKRGKPVDVSEVLTVDAIFTDANKGLQAPEKKLQEVFKTSDAIKIAETILKRGKLQLTSEQRNQLVEDKRRQIVSFISRHCIDPRTGRPHPLVRIEQAMEQSNVKIDLFRGVEEQSNLVIEALRPVLPLKIEQVRVAVKIPPEYAARSIGVVKNFGSIEKEEWQADGSWIAVVDMPAGLHTAFIEKLGGVTRGNLQVKFLKGLSLSIEK
ncbi:MAG: ribosome assembly factor SBDS [Candidatus Bathyarchaeota archaeon]|nr:ribosome assembly factor SBDS [Candidatus Bathyarchaeota archaeon]